MKAVIDGVTLAHDLPGAEHLHVSLKLVDALMIAVDDDVSDRRRRDREDQGDDRHRDADDEQAGVSALFHLGWISVAPKDCLSVQKFDPERGREERTSLERVVPRHAHAAQRLGADESREIAGRNLYALDRDTGEAGLRQLAPLEEHVLEARAGEVAFAHAAVAEDDALQLEWRSPARSIRHSENLTSCSVASASSAPVSRQR